MDIIKLNGENFEETLSTRGVTAAVDFYAERCGASRMLRRVFSQCAKEHPEILFCSVNADNEEELAYESGVNVFPTVILYESGREVARQEGLCGKQILDELFLKSLDDDLR